MTRQIREFSNSNVYHIIIKGNNDSEIFYDDMDRNVFLDRIKLTKDEFKYKPKDTSTVSSTGKDYDE